MKRRDAVASTRGRWLHTSLPSASAKNSRWTPKCGGGDRARPLPWGRARSHAAVSACKTCPASDAPLPRGCAWQLAEKRPARTTAAASAVQWAIRPNSSRLHNQAHRARSPPTLATPHASTFSAAGGRCAAVLARAPHAAWTHLRGSDVDGDSSVHPSSAHNDVHRADTPIPGGRIPHAGIPHAGFVRRQVGHTGVIAAAGAALRGRCDRRERMQRNQRRQSCRGRRAAAQPQRGRCTHGGGRHREPDIASSRCRGGRNRSKRRRRNRKSPGTTLLGVGADGSTLQRGGERCSVAHAERGGRDGREPPRHPGCQASQGLHVERNSRTCWRASASGRVGAKHARAFATLLSHECASSVFA